MSSTLGEVPFFQLLQWKYALRLEVKTKGKMRLKGGRTVTAHVKKLLGLKRSTPREDILKLVEDAVKERFNENS